jgi:hypothetical protein
MEAPIITSKDTPMPIKQTTPHLTLASVFASMAAIASPSKNP